MILSIDANIVNLRPDQTLRDKAVDKVVRALVERRHIVPVVLKTAINGLKLVLQALGETVKEIKALVGGLLDGVLAREAGVQPLVITRRVDSHNRHGGNEEHEKEGEQLGETH